MRQTRVLEVDPERPDPALVDEAARLLRAGGLVAFPTETVYGLGAHALNPQAVRGIFAAKERPADNPLIVHVSDEATGFALVNQPPPAAFALAQAFWPGPLTLVLESKGSVPPETTAGLSTVALRVPDHPVALALLAAAGIPVAAPSANRSGRPSPTRAEHVLADLEGRVDAILDGGETGIGVESTVIDLTAAPPLILRPGGVTREQIERVIGPVAEGDGGQSSGAPRSPGLKYRHYAPRARAIVVNGRPERVAEAVLRAAEQRPGRVAFLLTDETIAALRRRVPHVFGLGSKSAPEEAARRLYHGLRAMDRSGIDAIVIEGYDEKGIGRALMDRMRRAAAEAVVDADTLLEDGLASPGFWENGETARC